MNKTLPLKSCIYNRLHIRQTFQNKKVYFLQQKNCVLFLNEQVMLDPHERKL